MIEIGARLIAAALAPAMLAGGACAALARADASRPGQHRRAPQGSVAHRGSIARRGSVARRGSIARRGSVARRGSTVRVDDHAKLHLVKYAWSTLIEEGRASGTLPGRTRVRLTVGAKISARFTVHTRNGTITGRGGATLKSSGRYASFGGWLSVTGGSGRYRHAHGKGRLYGVIDRRTHTLTVTTVGTLRY